MSAAAASVRVGVTQTPEFRHDLPAAVAHLNRLSERADAAGVALLILPEGYLQGYLLAGPDIRAAALNLSSPAFAAVLARFPAAGPVIVAGLIEEAGGRYFNTAIVVRARRLIGRYRKRHLLGAERLFTAGSDCPVFTAGALRFGIGICYDTAFPETARDIAAGGAALIACPANNMMSRARAEAFRDVHNAERARRCVEAGLWLASSDVTGERGDMVSWGPAAVIAPDGTVVARLPAGEPGLLIHDIPVAPGRLIGPDAAAGPPGDHRATAAAAAPSGKALHP